MGLQAILFDVDGTLADTERDGHRVAFNRAFADAGLGWVWDESLYGELLAVTGGKERIRHYVEQWGPPLPERTGSDLTTFIAGLHAAKTRHFVELLAGGAIPLRPGVRRLLDEARQCGIRLAIATTTTPENVEQLLRCTLGAEAIDWFEVIAAGDVVPAKKPDPAIYTWALERMGLDPHGCVAIEDSRNGLRAALGADLPTLITVSPYTENEAMDGAALVVDQLGEPGQPFRVLAGESFGRRLVDVDLLRHVAAGG